MCDQHWTDLEADAACRELGKRGGYAYCGVSNTDTPMVVGGFNCTADQSSIKHCDFKGFGDSLGCQYPITKGYRKAAGVFCYDHEGKFYIPLLFIHNLYICLSKIWFIPAGRGLNFL